VTILGRIRRGQGMMRNLLKVTEEVSSKKSCKANSLARGRDWSGFGTLVGGGGQLEHVSAG